MTAPGQVRLRVHLDGADPFEVETRLSDHNLWDITRAKHKWPTGQEAPVTWLAFIAWAAGRRTGHIASDVTWEAFLRDCESVENVPDEEGEQADVDPTQPVLGPA